MDLELENKLVLVTGSTKGIGYSIAKRFCELGSEVILNGRGKDSVHACSEEIRKQLPHAKLLEAPFDLGTKEGCDGLISWLDNDVGRPLDVLINNMGIFQVQKFEEIEDEEWFRFFEVNVMSGVRLCRHIFPKMLERKYGNIVFISSEASVCPKPFMIHYSMTKTCQLTLSRGLAELAAGFPHVRVNTVMPGPTATEGVLEYLRKGFPDKPLDEVVQSYVKSVEPTSLLQRFIEPSEIANLVVFIASGKHAINGASISSEGGIIKHI